MKKLIGQKIAKAVKKNSKKENWNKIPLKCVFCGAELSSKVKLQQHMKKSHSAVKRALKYNFFAPE